MTFFGDRGVSSRLPLRDYYKEARGGLPKPSSCPRCTRPMILVSNVYEVGKRVPSVFAEGFAFCASCNENVVRAEDISHGGKLAVCARCQLCVCFRCQKHCR